MKYKLLNNSLNDKENIVETVLLNRGIKDTKKYLSLDESCVDDYNNLDNIDKAVECFCSHFERGDDICVLCDTDP